MPIIARLAAAAFAVALAGAAPAPVDRYAWVQYGADGRAHVRELPAPGAPCPSVTVDGTALAMIGRIAAGDAFARSLCDVALPPDVRRVTLGATELPAPGHSAARIAVIGDTGCRIKGTDVQDCGDPAAWPFARIAASIARERPRPDVIVHVGDYQYRESACPPADRRCAGSPFGDDWAAWDADFFTPAAPLFATAPLVLVRGNHEDCKRSGIGWSRYLAPEPAAACRTHEGLAVAAFDDVQIANVDSAAGDETDPDPAVFERDERAADALTAGRETLLATHRPPVAYLRAHGSRDGNGLHLAAILAGHIHTFATASFAGAPPLLVLGNGGDLLTADEATALGAALPGTVETRFGYTILDRAAGGGWTISERDPDGAEHRRCTLRERVVRC